MVWTYECVGSALSEHVTPSEPTYLANESVGTLYDGTNELFVSVDLGSHAMGPKCVG